MSEVDYLPPMSSTSKPYQLPPEAQAANLPAATRANTDMFGARVTAQPVPVPRDEAKVFERMRTLAQMNGSRYVYAWPVKNRQTGQTDEVKGATIKMANDLARCYGNCDVDVRVIDNPTHWLIYARFVDLETGFSMTRPFQQRKNQNTGMRDQDRATDLIFQTGVSKALRNVILNALQTYVDFVMEESEKRLVEWVESNGEKARKQCQEWLDKNRISMRSAEIVIGRPFKDWVARDLTRCLSILRGIEDGLTVASEAFPSEEDAEALAAEKEAKAKEDEKPKAKSAKKAPAPKKTASKKAESGPKEEEPVEQDLPSEDLPHAPEPKPVNETDSIDEETGEVTESDDSGEEDEVTFL